MNQMADVIAAPSFHGGVSGWVILVVILVVGVPLSLWQMRRSETGPQMSWLPRFMGGDPADQSHKNGRQEPSDDNGDSHHDRS